VQQLVYAHEPVQSESRWENDGGDDIIDSKPEQVKNDENFEDHQENEIGNVYEQPDTFTPEDEVKFVPTVQDSEFKDCNPVEEEKPTPHINFETSDNNSKKEREREESSHSFAEESNKQSQKEAENKTAKVIRPEWQPTNPAVTESKRVKTAEPNTPGHAQRDTDDDSRLIVFDMRGDGGNNGPDSELLDRLRSGKAEKVA